jgi:hypothetical protein
MRLPGAERATIPTDKLVRYALDPAHPRGRHKARVFASALGIRKQDWRYLHDQILEALPDAPVRSMRITPFGVAYEVVVAATDSTARRCRSSRRGSSKAMRRRASRRPG